MVLGGIVMAVLVALAIMWVLPGRPRRLARVLTLFGLSAVLLVVLLCGQAALVISRTVLNPSFHSTAVEKANLAPLLSAAVATQVAQEVARQIGKGAQPQEVARLVEDCLTHAVSPQWVKEQLDGAIGGLLSYLHGRTPALDVSIDLREPKAAALDFLGAAKIDRRVSENLRKLVSRTPDSWSAASIAEIRDVEELLGKWRPAVRAVSLAIPAAAVVAAVTALLVGLVCRRSRATATWLGITTLVAGLGSVVLAMAGQPLLGRYLAAAGTSPSPAGVLLQRWLEIEAQGIMGMEQTAGLLTLAAGLALLLAPALVRRRTAPVASGVARNS
ncbi:MAG: hypothetical protein AB1446_02320 [Bacillota bacterium]